MDLSELRELREDLIIEGEVHTSWTTSLSSSSTSFSALRKRCQRSSPTLPRCNKTFRACFALRMAMMRLMSSAARRNSAALRTLSGTATDFSLLPLGSRWRRERYMFRCKCGGNHGSREEDFAGLLLADGVGG